MKSLQAFIGRLVRVIAISAILVLPLSCSASEPEDGASVVLITGANRGLGLEFARQYSEAGWTVIGTARSPGRAVELATLNVEVMQLDVTDAESVARLASDLEGRSIDMLINNAGIFPRFSTLAEAEFDSIAMILDVNVIGPMRVTKALMPNLAAGEQKKIINITSGLGSIENNGFGQFYGYRESKAALNMFSKTLSVELADQGFTSIALHPGWVQTDMGGPEATLTPEESITGMRAVIDKVTPADSGTYWGVQGEQVPW